MPIWLAEFGNLESPAYGQVYVRGHVIDLSPVNTAYYLISPHFSDIEGTRLDEDANFDEVDKVLTDDAESSGQKLTGSTQI